MKAVEQDLNRYNQDVLALWDHLDETPTYQDLMESLQTCWLLIIMVISVGPKNMTS